VRDSLEVATLFSSSLIFIEKEVSSAFVVISANAIQSDE
jgi:hypothetical protein